MAPPSRESTFPRSMLAPIETEFRFRQGFQQGLLHSMEEWLAYPSSERPSAESKTIAGYFSNIAIADSTKGELLIEITSHRSSHSSPIYLSMCIMQYGRANEKITRSMPCSDIRYKRVSKEDSTR